MAHIISVGCHCFRPSVVEIQSLSVARNTCAEGNGVSNMAVLWKKANCEHASIDKWQLRKSDRAIRSEKLSCSSLPTDSLACDSCIELPYCCYLVPSEQMLPTIGNGSLRCQFSGFKHTTSYHNPSSLPTITSSLGIIISCFPYLGTTHQVIYRSEYIISCTLSKHEHALTIQPYL